MASVAYTADDRTVSMGRAFARAFSTIAHNPLVALALALIFGVLPSLASGLALTLSTVAATRTVAPVRFFAITMAATFVFVAIGSIAEGALVRATVAETEGREAGFGECATAALRVVLPLIGIGLIVMLGMMLGMILLIVPGIIVYLMWSVAVPACVEEGDGVFASLGRSRELTSGARWKILAIFLVFWMAYLLLTLLLRVVGIHMYSAFSPAGELTAWNLVGTAVLTTISVVFSSTLQASLYVELREWKEGRTFGHLEQVFA